MLLIALTGVSGLDICVGSHCCVAEAAEFMMVEQFEVGRDGSSSNLKCLG